MKAKETRELLKTKGLKRTDINVTTGKGSSGDMILLTIKTKGSYEVAKKLFGNDRNFHISCSNALMD